MAQGSKLSLKARKRWSLVILLVGLPVYVVVAVSVINWLYPDPMMLPPPVIQIGIFLGIGLLWAFPLKFIFKGVGQADPDA